MAKPRTFRQSDLERAIRAAQRCGLTVTGCKITPDGEIEVLTGAAPAHELTPYEQWLAQHEPERAPIKTDRKAFLATKAKLAPRRPSSK